MSSKNLNTRQISGAELVDRLINVAISNRPDTKQYARETISLILKEAIRQGVTDPRQLAYILATAEHESEMGKGTIERWGPSNQQSGYEGRKDLGNTVEGDGQKFLGRGFVQITGRKNYTEWSNRLGFNFPDKWDLSLTTNPTKTAQPSIAAQIIVGGMRDGTFTGKGLDDYFNGKTQNLNQAFFNARAIVNGDKDTIEPGSTKSNGQKIADAAEKYYQQLKDLDLKNVRIPDPPTYKPTLEYNSNTTTASNIYVYQVQTMLKQLGYAVTVDGEFGSKSEKLVKQFQKDQNLPQTGKVDSETWKRLETLVRQRQSGHTSTPENNNTLASDLTQLQQTYRQYAELVRPTLATGATPLNLDQAIAYALSRSGFTPDQRAQIIAAGSDNIPGNRTQAHAYVQQTANWPEQRTQQPVQIAQRQQ
jgi:hypothetical protein